MLQIKSKVDNSVIHIIYRQNDTEYGRQELVSANEFLQCSVISIDKEKNFAAHKHLDKDINYTTAKAQEAWVVIKGSVKVDYYDIDNSFLESQLINQGDISITLHGGHGYEIQNNDTIVYEFKTGPYYGPELDKTYF